MDAGRYVAWPGKWDGSPVLDVWIDTYVGMQFYETAHPGELLSDAAFDFVDGMISAPDYDGGPCTSTPIDHEIAGSNRTVTYQIDCVDKLDNGPGDYIVTLARGDSHLIYIKAFSGTHGNNALEVPSSEVQEFYDAVQITVT